MISSRQRKLKQRTLTKDLTISLVLIVVMVSVVTIGFNYAYTSHIEEKRLENIADEYRSYLIESLELPIWTLDRKISTKIAESYFNNALVDMIRVSEKFYDSHRLPYDRIIFGKSKTDAFDLVIRDFEIRHDGKIIGNVKFGLTRRFYKENLRHLLISNILILLLTALSLIILTAVLIRILVNKPLKALLQGINQVSRGNYDYEFKAFKQAEFESIISDFKFMADQIKGREDTLAEMNKQLAWEVAARKKVETAIRNSEAQLRATFEASSDGILVTDDDGRIINANDRFYRMWQMPEDLKSGKTESMLMDFIRQHLKQPEMLLSKPSETGQPCVDELYLKDGSVFECIYRPLTAGEIKTGTVMNFREVTDLKKSIQALRESEDRFRQLSEAALEAIIIHDNGIVLQVNDQFLKMFAYHRREVIGKLDFIRTIAPEFREMFDPEIIPQQMSFLEIMGVRKDGSEFPIIVQSKEMKYYGKYVTVSVVRDVSDRKAAEAETRTLKEKLARSKKMEALGLLAGGVAHDLNNILSGIVSYPELLLMKKGLDEKTRKALKVIQESGERAAAVVNDLTTMSRGIASNREVLSLNSVVKEYLISPEYHKLKMISENIDLKTELKPDLFPIEASRLHIRKSIMNLVTNASEAIESGGQIVISTANLYLDRPLRAYSDVKKGEYAVLSVADTGNGISDDEVDRIFEPFYTKKVMGRSGTGLGLTVVWNTVQDHNGYVVVRNKPKGTRFELYFPITRDNVKAQMKKVSMSAYRGNNEYVLVVDDEKNQRDIACAMLTALGYRTAEASSGEAAIDEIRKHPFDLILLDMIMPSGINGLETYRHIIQSVPGQKAIIASGYSISKDVKAAQQLGVGCFLKKPYIIEQLGMAVKEELARRRG